jgi:hypothetical protein
VPPFARQSWPERPKPLDTLCVHLTFSLCSSLSLLWFVTCANHPMACASSFRTDAIQILADFSLNPPNSPRAKVAALWEHASLLEPAQAVLGIRNAASADVFETQKNHGSAEISESKTVSSNLCNTA